MKKQNIIALIVVIVLIGVFALNILLGGQEEIASDSFAQCLAEKGAKMYGTEWCSHCNDQKEMFGEAFRFIDFIDCDADRSICNAEKITGYPTWQINGQNFQGTKSLKALSELSSCEL